MSNTKKCPHCGYFIRETELIQNFHDHCRERLDGAVYTFCCCRCGTVLECDTRMEIAMLVNTIRKRGEG
ncbi:MAG: hypothetical protein KAY24_01040 [Candidatus Eisenbacteria sp.]|nr:hypothetical protein [Candidatus Eisenbacteria bacterium]